jgi:hypothetical protein
VAWEGVNLKQDWLHSSWDGQLGQGGKKVARIQFVATCRKLDAVGSLGNQYNATSLLGIGLALMQLQGVSLGGWMLHQLANKRANRKMGLASWPLEEWDCEI